MDAGEHLGPVIEARMSEQIADRSRHPGLVVPCAEDDAREPREHDRAGAHCARLEGDVQRAIA